MSLGAERLLNAALTYAGKGWPIFPCHPATKQPLLPPDIDPQSGEKIAGTGGLKKATTDFEAVRAYWGRYPKAMIGVPTGLSIGAFVVDIDAGADDVTGEVYDAATLQAELEATIGVRLPPTWECRTPRGGKHLYFAVKPGGEMPRNRTGIIPRVDVRGQGGYVVAPPSVRDDGAAYEWRASPEEVELAFAPQPLLDVVLRSGRHEVSGPEGATETRSTIPRVVRDQRRYALAAFDSEISELRNAPQGTRNDHLFRTALKLGQLVGSGDLDEQMVRGSLEAVAKAWPNFPKSLATINSGFTRGMRDPRECSAVPRETNVTARVPTQINANTSSQTARGTKEQLDAELALVPMTDLGNAERFAKRLHNELLWCDKGGWLRWDGRRYTHNGAEAAVKRAEHLVARCIQDEASWLRASGDDAVAFVKYKGTKHEEVVMQSDELARWGRLSEDARHLTAIARRAEAMMFIGREALDADKFKINVLNGTLVVCAGPGDGDPVEFRPHDPADRITMLMPVASDPAATCPRYDAFLQRVQPSEKVRRFLHQWGGLTLTGDVSEQRAMFWWGTGKNGKTTLLEGWNHLYGDYAKPVPVETFMSQRWGRSAGAASPDLAMLAGKRFVYTDEPEKNARLAEGLVKRVTGGDQIEVRHLNQGFFSMRPEFKLVLVGNRRPRIDGGDRSHGIWRRLLFVPWEVIIPEAERDKHLPDALIAEASGMLNRLLDGLRDWLEDGLIIPEEIEAATDEYRTENDPLGRFLAECTVRKAGARVGTTECWRLFCAWMVANGDRPWTQKSFSVAMSERGFKRTHSDIRYFLDVELTKTEADFANRSAEPADHEADRDAGDPDDDDIPF